MANTLLFAMTTGVGYRGIAGQIRTSPCERNEKMLVERS
jgi:hypothetical protein